MRCCRCASASSSLAAKAIGVPTRQVLFKELLPNLVAPIVISASLSLPAYVTAEAGLSFLGVGLVEPIPSWGQTIAIAPTGSRPTRCTSGFRWSASPYWCSHWPFSATRSETPSTPRLAGRSAIAPAAEKEKHDHAVETDHRSSGDGHAGRRSLRQPVVEQRQRRRRRRRHGRCPGEGDSTRLPRARPRKSTGAKKGGTVTVLSDVTPDTFDPTNIYYVDGNQIGKLIYRALTQYRLDRRTGKPVLVPDLAEDLGTKSADGLTWTFKLKKGIKYQDGTPVKAADYAYAIKRSFAHDLYDAGPTYQIQFFKDGDNYKGPYGRTVPTTPVSRRRTTAPWSSTWPRSSTTCRSTRPSRCSRRSRRRRTPRRTTSSARWRPARTRSTRTPRVPAQADEEPELGPEHRPGAAPVRGRLGLQVQPRTPSRRSVRCWPAPARTRTR